MSSNFSNISINEFKKYFSGKMTTAEKKTFEELIENEEFAKDAFNGFVAMDNNKRAVDFIEKSLATSSKKIGLQEIESKTPVISIYKSLSIAAVFVLIIGGFWISYSLLNKENDTIAKNEIVEKEKIASPEKNIEQDRNDTVVESVIEDEIEQEITIKKPSKKIVEDLKPKEDVTAKVDAIADNSKKISEPQPQKTPTSSSNESFGKNETTISQNNFRSEIKTFDSEDYEESDLENEPSNYDIGYKKFQSGDLLEATSYFEASLKEEKKVTVSMYYLGLSSYYLQDYNKAINNFDQVIQSNNKSFKYNSMWYKADILIKKGNRKAAKKLLSEISESDSLFKNQAIELLKTL